MIRLFSQYVSPKSIVLVAVEGGLMTFALVCGVWIRFWGTGAGFDISVALPDFALQAGAFVTILQICFYYCDLYDLRAIRHLHEQLISLGQSIGAACLLLGLLYFIFPALWIGRGVFFISLVLAAAFVISNRAALDRLWQVAAPQENLIILGAAELAATVGRELKQRNDLNVRLVGFVSLSGSNCRDTEICGSPVLGACDELPVIVADYSISRIVVAVEDRRNSLPIRDLVRLRVAGIRVEDAHSTVSALTGRVWLQTVKPS